MASYRVELAEAIRTFLPSSFFAPGGLWPRRLDAPTAGLGQHPHGLG
jgi:hypothetical protein